MARPLATKRAFIKRKNVTIYVFDKEGNKIDEGLSPDIAEKYKTPYLRIYVANKTFFKGAYYFSKNKKFKVPFVRNSTNPIVKEFFKNEKERMNLLKKEAQLSKIKI